MELFNMVPMWLIILVIVFLTATLIAMTVTYLRERTLDQIRAEVYQLFLAAEHRYKESAQGRQKMKWVIQQARGLLPEWAKAIISEELLSLVLQEWFDGIKDLLDDGKMNKTA